MNLNFKKINFFIAIIAMVAFIMPSCEKDSVSDRDSKKDKEEQVDSDKNDGGSSTNSASCWEITLTINDVGGSSFTEIIYTWGTEKDVKKYVEAIAEIQEQDPDVASCKSSAKATDDSEMNCEDYNEYWSLDEIIEELENAGWVEDSNNSGNSNTDAQCWEIQFLINDPEIDYTPTFSYVIWGTEEDAEEIADEVYKINYEQVSISYNIIKLDSSQNACQNNEDYIGVDEFWSTLE